MTLPEAARKLEMTEQNLRVLCQEGIVRAEKRGRGAAWQIKPCEVARFKRALARRQMFQDPAVAANE